MMNPLREARHKKILIKYSLRSAEELPEGSIRDLFLAQAARLEVQLAQITCSAEYHLATQSLKPKSAKRKKKAK